MIINYSDKEKAETEYGFCGWSSFFFFSHLAYCFKHGSTLLEKRDLLQEKVLCIAKKECSTV